MTKRQGDLKRRDDRQEPSLAEKILMVVSVLITVGLFGFTAYMGATAPDRPDVDLRITHTEPKDDALQVHVEVHNRGPEGYREVTIEVTCDDPAPTATLENLAASGKKRAILVCPLDTEDPEARLVALLPA